MADEQAKYVFKVSDAVPKSRDAFVFLEPVDGGLGILKKSGMNLGFVLRDGSQQEADKVADYLNRHIEALTIW
jgi:hypothetical protein